MAQRRGGVGNDIRFSRVAGLGRDVDLDGPAAGAPFGSILVELMRLDSRDPLMGRAKGVRMSFVADPKSTVADSNELPCTARILGTIHGGARGGAS
jgi:hypothetical protein